MPEQHEIINDLFDEVHRRFYEKPEFGNCSLCGRYDKLVPSEDWCYLCNESLDEDAENEKSPGS